jgi:flavin reductase (DIM6/NTAB) family NADH-FMN oxidoreductase RutF
MNTKTMHNLTYGLFVLAANDGSKLIGCITNTVIQQTSDPLTISVSVNKSNYTNEVIKKTHQLTVSILDESVPFDIFKRFGFSSGRDTNKLEGFDDYKLTDNQTFYLTKYANAYLSGEVVQEVDLSTHTIFIVEIKEAEVLSTTPSVTYTYYFKHIKPKPAVTNKKGWVCTICGYVYEGEVLPPDFICPVCKHPASDFKPIE